MDGYLGQQWPLELLEGTKMIIYLSLLIALVGVVMYLICNGPSPNSPKLAEIGRIMFFCGLLAFLLMIASGHPITVLH
jgi:hypothetical protein